MQIQVANEFNMLKTRWWSHFAFGCSLYNLTLAKIMASDASLAVLKSVDRYIEQPSSIWDTCMKLNILMNSNQLGYAKY